MEIETDICHYTGKFLKGILLALVCVFFSYIFLFSTADALAWITAMIVSQTLLEANGEAVLFLAVLSIVITIVITVAILAFIHTLIEDIPKDSMIMNMVKARKGKYCVRIKFHE
jgi:hypothetical protein